MGTFTPQTGSIETSGTAHDGLESERIKDLTQADIGYGTEATEAVAGVTYPNVESDEIADNAVTTAKIADDAVTSDKIGDRDIDAVTGTTYVVLATDHMRVKNLTNGTGCAVSVPDGLPDGFQCDFLDGSTGGTHTIDASGTAALAPVHGAGPLTMSGGMASVVVISDVVSVAGAS